VGVGAILSDFDNFSPTLGLELHPTMDVMIYGSWSKGFKTGSWTTRLSSPHPTYDASLHFDPEKASVTIRANEGTLSNNSEHAYLNGDVRIHRPAYAEHEELGLLTSYLHVIPEQGFAETDREVTMISGKSTVKSVGLEFNNKTREVKLLSNVKGQLETPAKNRQVMPWDKKRKHG
jgi:hypothetical protein